MLGDSHVLSFRESSFGTIAAEDVTRASTWGFRPTGLDANHEFGAAACALHTIC